ncbi:MAG: rnfE [Proteobacteria bacterium]|nr:rnfE [Pseudomonadota bacterium]
MSQNLTDVAWNGLWKQNAGLVQMLGMCPILAVSTSIVNGVSLGLATALVMAASNGVSSALRNYIPYEIRIPVFILIIAALVTMLDLAMNAWMHPIYLVLGIYIPLIVTNCLVLARVEAFAAKNGVLASTVDGAAMGIGLALLLGVLGGIREFFGNGALFNGIELVIPGTHAIQILSGDYPGFLFAILPPGAFITLACLIAAKNWAQARKSSSVRVEALGCAPGAH